MVFGGGRGQLDACENLALPTYLRATFPGSGVTGGKARHTPVPRDYPRHKNRCENRHTDLCGSTGLHPPTVRCGTDPESLRQAQATEHRHQDKEKEIKSSAKLEDIYSSLFVFASL